MTRSDLVEALASRFSQLTHRDAEFAVKAILDAIKGYTFHDDAQVARLLVERRAGEREQIAVTVRKLSDVNLLGAAYQR